MPTFIFTDVAGEHALLKSGDFLKLAPGILDADEDVDRLLENRPLWNLALLAAREFQAERGIFVVPVSVGAARRLALVSDLEFAKTTLRVVNDLRSSLRLAREQHALLAKENEGWRRRAKELEQRIRGLLAEIEAEDRAADAAKLQPGEAGS